MSDPAALILVRYHRCAEEGQLLRLPSGEDVEARVRELMKNAQVKEIVVYPRASTFARATGWEEH